MGEIKLITGIPQRCNRSRRDIKIYYCNGDMKVDILWLQRLAQVMQSRRASYKKHK
uniref:Uncharacterized protein n=1 Tax=Anguilla anguilla TaxID=7936 RepID=A0A0E9XVL4_ANGAN